MLVVEGSKVSERQEARDPRKQGLQTVLRIFMLALRGHWKRLLLLFSSEHDRLRSYGG